MNPFKNPKLREYSTNLFYIFLLITSPVGMIEILTHRSPKQSECLRQNMKPFLCYASTLTGPDPFPSQEPLPDSLRYTGSIEPTKLKRCQELAQTLTEQLLINVEALEKKSK